MAKKNERPFVRSEFVNYQLSKGNTARLRTFAAKEWQGGEWLEKFVQEGYKLTLSWDDKRDCACAWALPQGPSAGNQGLILSGRGGSVTNAVIELVFKHYVLFKGEWPHPIEGGSWTWDKEEEEGPQEP